MKQGIEAESLRTRQGFHLLYEVSRALVSDRYLEEVLSLVVMLTAECIGSKICSLMLLDEDKGELVIKATQSLSQEYRNKAPIKVGESVIGRAVQLKRPVTVLDVQREAGYAYPELAKKEGLQSLASVPMRIRERVIGVLNCYTPTRHAFTEEEIEILTAVANLAALAIENTKLLEERESAVEALETRKKVERAKGIFMRRFQYGEEEAYRLLQRQSMEKRRSLRDIAEAVILSEEFSC